MYIDVVATSAGLFLLLTVNTYYLRKLQFNEFVKHRHPELILSEIVVSFGTIVFAIILRPEENLWISCLLKRAAFSASLMLLQCISIARMMMYLREYQLNHRDYTILPFVDSVYYYLGKFLCPPYYMKLEEKILAVGTSDSFSTSSPLKVYTQEFATPGISNPETPNNAPFEVNVFEQSFGQAVELPSVKFTTSTEQSSNISEQNNASDVNKKTPLNQVHTICITQAESTNGSFDIRRPSSVSSAGESFSKSQHTAADKPFLPDAVIWIIKMITLYIFWFVIIFLLLFYGYYQVKDKGPLSCDVVIHGFGGGILVILAFIQSTLIYINWNLKSDMLWLKFEVLQLRSFIIFIYFCCGVLLLVSFPLFYYVRLHILIFLISLQFMVTIGLPSVLIFKKDVVNINKLPLDLETITDFEKAWKNKDFRFMLEEIARSHFAYETIAFLKCTEDLHRVSWRRYRAIIKKFVADGALLELNLSSELKERLMKCYTDRKPSLALIKETRNTVVGLIVLNFQTELRTAVANIDKNLYI